jgi:hypothetical protein
VEDPEPEKIRALIFLVAACERAQQSLEALWDPDDDDLVDRLEGVRSEAEARLRAVSADYAMRRQRVREQP